MRHRILAILALMVTHAAGCSEPLPQEGDLGVFVPEDLIQEEDDVQANYESEEVWTHLCSPTTETKLHWLYVGVQMFETTMEHQLPGLQVPGVTVDFYDFCDTKVHSLVTNEQAVGGFQILIDGDGFDGYLEYTQENYPLFRQFDKPFRQFVQIIKGRMFEGPLFEAPLTVVGQSSSRGYIQGTVYNWYDEKPLPGAVIEAEIGGKKAGEVWYLPDALPVPSQALKATEKTGAFFVVNLPPGQVLLRATLSDGRVFERPAKTWRLDSFPRKTITEVGIPVYPDQEFEVCDAYNCPEK